MVRVQTYVLLAAGKGITPEVRLRGTTSTFQRAVSGNEPLNPWLAIAE
jgi:hypothetical protein